MPRMTIEECRNDWRRTAADIREITDRIASLTTKLLTATMDHEDDWAGWYQLTIFRAGGLSAECRWWNGKEWNHAPNMRRGWKTEDLGDVRGIVHLVEA